MRKITVLFAGLCIAMLSLIPTASHATIQWGGEGFEYANDAAFGAVWAYSCLGNPGITTERVHSGSKAVKLTYRGHAGVDPGAGGCFMDRPFSRGSDTQYTRMWIYLDNFILDQTVGTKILSSGEDCCYPSFWWNIASNGYYFILAVQGVILNNGTQDSYGFASNVALPQNQWFCMESRITMSTPGVDNGIAQLWINGTQAMNVTNARMRAATLNQKNSPTAQFRRAQIYTQHGRGAIFYDDLAIDLDARIGCGSADSTPPATPSNFVVQ